MLDGLYRWVLRLADSPRAAYALGAVSFAESSFFPIPPDVLLVPMVLAQPRRAWIFATIATVASVLGGVLGYALGALLFETVGAWLIHLYGYEQKMDALRAAYQNWGAWLILIKGLTPIPYKLVTIVSGLLGYDFTLFLLLSVVTRGLRFFALSGLLLHFGEPIKAQLDKRFGTILVGFLLLIGLGFWVAVHAV